VSLLIASFNLSAQCKDLYQKKVVKDSTINLPCDMVLMSFDSYYDYYFYKYQSKKIGDSVKYINKEIHVLRNKYKKYLEVNETLLKKSEDEINKLANNTHLLRSELIKKDGELKSTVYQNKRLKRQRNRSYLVILFTGLLAGLFVI